MRSPDFVPSAADDEVIDPTDPEQFARLVVESADTRPATKEQERQLLYSRVLLTRDDFAKAANRDEASALIRASNRELGDRGALVSQDAYEYEAHAYVQAVLGKGPS